MSDLRILIADDHDIVRQGLRAILERQPHWQVCGEATNGRQAVQMTLELKPDVLVLDFSMPELNGLEAIRQIRHEAPRTEVLVLTMHDSDRLAREFLAAGARAYLLKADAAKLLIQAIDHLKDHKPFFTPKVSELVLSGFLSPRTEATEGAVCQLTTREREIVQLIAEGKTSKEAATLLKLSVHTIETHRTNIMRKLGIHTVSELVRYAIRNHITEA
jgi:DNA-binding NarL/FixJ family response regulator